MRQQAAGNRYKICCGRADNKTFPSSYHDTSKVRKKWQEKWFNGGWIWMENLPIYELLNNPCKDLLTTDFLINHVQLKKKKFSLSHFIRIISYVSAAGSIKINKDGIALNAAKQIANLFISSCYSQVFLMKLPLFWNCISRGLSCGRSQI